MRLDRRKARHPDLTMVIVASRIFAMALQNRPFGAYSLLRVRKLRGLRTPFFLNTTFLSVHSIFITVHTLSVALGGRNL